MLASRWPHWLDNIWAKSAELGAQGNPETLAQHTWNVLERLTEMINLRPDLPQNLGVPRLWNSLFWSAFLHDFGKSTKGFQAQLRPKGKKWLHRHEVLSLAFIDWIAPGLWEEEKLWIVAGIVSHHKESKEISGLYPTTDEEIFRSPLSELNEVTLQGLWRWLDECTIDWIGVLSLRNKGISKPSLPRQSEAVAMIQQDGANRIRYWLRAYQRFIRQMEEQNNPKLIIGCMTLRGHIINADHSASAHAGEMPKAQFDIDNILVTRGLSTSNLFNYQLQASMTENSALLTAPTGSGKTEAALLWAANQSRNNRLLPRLFYTLPYQASMNAMKIRLEESFPGLVGLQHGRGLLALYRLLLEKEYEPSKASNLVRWERNLANLNYPPIRIFSPYQMLKGMYRLKGYEAMLSDYHGAAFIFDEIHAYEVKRLAYILKTMEYLKQNFNARFLVMSATFPTLIKEWLREVLGDPKEIIAENSLFHTFIRHQVILHNGEMLSDNGLEPALNDARCGKSVLVVCNTVDRAQLAYNELKEKLKADKIHVELMHGRFNMRDRSSKEKLVRDATGSKSINRRSIVLVATQVIEVSLDIDLDTIYTDPAPLEALIQRFGRVNRRRKQIEPARVHVFRQPDDGQMIYDTELVKRTLSILEREDKKAIDEGAIAHWLDEIYRGEIADRWKKEYSIAAKEFHATCVNTLKPFMADETLEEMFYKAFDSLEVLPEILYDEYKNLSIEDPILANELLVPISWKRYYMLARKKQVLSRNKGEPYIIKANYESERGLTFFE